MSLDQPVPATITSQTLPLSSSIDERRYAELVSRAAVVEGHDLTDQEALIGVPFIITALTYRDGIPRRETRDGKKVEIRTNYVTLEIVVGTQLDLNVALSRKRITKDQYERLTPLEPLVFNDGSTGICRQVTAYLHKSGVITVPEGPEGGPAGESRYDTYRANWISSIVPSIVPLTDDLDHVPPVRFDLSDPETIARPLVCPRGLRRSDYDAAGQQSTTFYLA